MVRRARAYADLDDDDFVLARQINFETIHNHDVLAERFGTVGELRRELESGEHSTRRHRAQGLAARRPSARVAARRPAAAAELDPLLLAGQQPRDVGPVEDDDRRRPRRP